MEAHPAYAEFPVINCGVDWLTCTSKRVGVSNALEDFGMDQLAKAKAADGQISAAKRLGYVGLCGAGLFVGTRPTDVMMQVTGPPCTPLAREAITLATNVSRIDLQVTIWTEGEQCNLAKWTRDVLERRARESGAVRSWSLISSYPAGDTLSINQRCSDRYFRLYDKTAESNLGPQRLVWRYEVESKGIAARRLAELLREHGAHPPHVNNLVHGWYTEKGVQPAFSSVGCRLDFEPSVAGPKRDVLTWMRLSLSKTISAAIHAHGREVVLDALGLLDDTRVHGGVSNDSFPSEDHVGPYHFEL